MAKIIFYLLPIILGLSISVQAQISIGKNGQPHISAMLDMDVDSCHQGMLLPRIPIRGPYDRTSIPNPAEYLLVFSPYTETQSYMGLNYWHNNRWNRLLNQMELYDSISSNHIAQMVLFVNLKEPESISHVTDTKNTTPYKLQLDNVVYDSQMIYDMAAREYVIKDPGIYEIVCNATLRVPTGRSMQTYIRVGSSYVVNDLISHTSAITVGSVVYIAELKAGDRVSGAVGVGRWNNVQDAFTVQSGSLSILKY